MTRAPLEGPAPPAVSRARLHVEDPLLLHRLEAIVAIGVLLPWLAPRALRHAFPGGTALLLAIGLWGTLWTLWTMKHVRVVRASVEGEELLLKSWFTRFRVSPRNVARLGVDHRPCGMRIVLCDGRVFRVEDVDARVALAFESQVLKFKGPETFKLSGIPRLGRITRWLGAVPVVSGLVRPQLRVSDEALELSWGPFSLQRPLCQLVRARATVRGVLLRFSDQREIELCTYGNLGIHREWSTFELNRIVEERITEAKRRAQSLSIVGYRKRIRQLAPDSG